MDSYIGTIMPWISNNIPSGWMVCDGTQLQVSQYQPLYALIGNRYGGVQPSTFALPDLRGRTIVGVGMQSPTTNNYILGQNGGQEKVSLTTQEMPRHNHMLLANAKTPPVVVASPADNILGSPDGDKQMYVTSGTTTHMHEKSIATRGLGEEHENMGPFVTLNYIICCNGYFPSRD